MDRAATRTMVVSEMASCIIMRSFARAVIGNVSVGLKAVDDVNDKNK